ncbi:MAG: hypothetical protein OJF51_002417 [Nitrospira sp.]|jgi:hypothetical protein|nr:MAG: hypothetical protein OJF51_002417 [Nitrospira sp.]
MSNPLTIVNSETPAPKKKREKIVLIETEPEADWFVPAKTKRGRKVWYLRFRVTGWNPRLFGPFKSKRQCLLFLDDAIGSIQTVENEIRDDADRRRLDEPLAKVWLPIIEYPVCAQHRPNKKT